MSSEEVKKKVKEGEITIDPELKEANILVLWGVDTMN